jgi:flagellar hook-associated protein 2
MSGIRLSGLASGLDTDAIVTQLMNVERVPRDRMARQQVTAQARQDALRSVDSKLTALKLAASDLRSALLWIPGQAVSSGDESVLTAKAISGAGPGAYSVTVGALATAQSATYVWDTNTGGQLSVDFAKDGVAQTAWTHTFASGTSVSDVATAINQDSAAPVWAVDVGGKLSLTRRETGDATWSGFSATAPQIAGPPVSTRAGSDSSYTVAGDATTYTSHTNVATGGLPGVELTLKSIGTASVSVSPPAVDPAPVAAKLKAFVTAYNDAVDLVRGKLAEKRAANPTTDDAAKQGVLFGDAALSGLLSSMRELLSDSGIADLGLKVPATGAGNSPDALAGKLTFSQTTFDSAWTKDPLAVQTKLGGFSATGFSQSFQGLIDPLVRAGDGLLDKRVVAADAQIGDIKSRLTRMDQRLESKEALLRKQFTALEQALSKSQSQSQDLAQRLNGLQQ